jgi:hypothetical protein
MENKSMKNFFFDYIYYRITKVYWRWEKRNSISAVIAIAMLQSMLIYDIFLFIIRLIFSRSEMAPYSKRLAYVGVILLLIFIYYNYKKYKNRFGDLQSKWKSEPSSIRFKKGILILLCLVAPWVIIILLGIWK